MARYFLIFYYSLAVVFWTLVWAGVTVSLITAVFWIEPILGWIFLFSILWLLTTRIKL